MDFQYRVAPSLFPCLARRGNSKTFLTDFKLVKKIRQAVLLGGAEIRDVEINNVNIRLDAGK